MREGKDGYKYIVIIKDDFSIYIWLVTTKTCDATSATKVLTECNSALGIAKAWISD